MKFLFFFFFSISSFGESSAPLFVIQRSLNSNEVHYDLNLKGAGIDLVNPISAYWIMNAKEGVREELSGIERRKF